MNHQSYREESRKNWGMSNPGNLNLDQVNCGALLRIADATEAMAKNHIRMQADLDYYKTLSQTRAEVINRLERSNAALRGTITKMKKRTL